MSSDVQDMYTNVHTAFTISLKVDPNTLINMPQIYINIFHNKISETLHRLNYHICNMGESNGHDDKQNLFIYMIILLSLWVSPGSPQGLLPAVLAWRTTSMHF